MLKSLISALYKNFIANFVHCTVFVCLMLLTLLKDYVNLYKLNTFFNQTRKSIKSFENIYSVITVLKLYKGKNFKINN